MVVVLLGIDLSLPSACASRQANSTGIKFGHPICRDCAHLVLKISTNMDDQYMKYIDLWFSIVARIHI